MALFIAADECSKDFGEMTSSAEYDRGGTTHDGPSEVATDSPEFALHTRKGRVKFGARQASKISVVQVVGQGLRFWFSKFKYTEVAREV